MKTTAQQAKAPPPPQDVLDRIARMAPKEIIALMLWQDRHANPGLARTITTKDLEGLEACLAYLKVDAEVQVIRPPGRPAQEAFTTKDRGTIPAVPAGPPKPFVTVALIEKGSGTTPTGPVVGNAITPVENNEKDYDRAMEAKALQRLRETAPTLAAQIRNDEARGILSKATILEAADALLALARP